MKLLPMDRNKGVRFNLSAKHGSRVFVAGAFNKWNPTLNQMNYDIVLDEFVPKKNQSHLTGWCSERCSQ